MSDNKAAHYYRVLYSLNGEVSSPERAVSVMLSELTTYGHRKELVVQNIDTGKTTVVTCNHGEILWNGDNDE